MSDSPDRMSPQERRVGASLAAIFALRMLGLFIILPVFALHAETDGKEQCANQRVAGVDRNADGKGGSQCQDAGGKDQRPTDQHTARIAQPDIVHEGETDAGIAEHDGHQFPPAEGLALKQHADQDGECRVGEQDQAFKAGRNVFQPPEVENAGAVIAQTAEQGEPTPVTRSEPAAGLLASQADPEKNRQRKTHAQRQQRDRVHTIGIGQLDENGFHRKVDWHELGGASGLPAGTRTLSRVADWSICLFAGDYARGFDSSFLALATGFADSPGRLDCAYRSR